MASANDAGRFFQTDESIEEIERKSRKSANTFGDPIKLGSKLLAIQIDQTTDASNDAVYVAEAAASVTGVRLSTNEISKSPRGPAAPLTCLTLCKTAEATRIFSGCWDKSIWTYTFPTGEGSASAMGPKVSSFSAHADFVKCITIVPTPDKQMIVVSGGADGDVRLWTLEGKPLGKVSPKCRAIECIVVDPMSSPEAPVVFFSTSQREIFQMTIPAMAGMTSSAIQLSSPVIAHETSVYKLAFDGDGDLWTASADKTAKHLLRQNGWLQDTVLHHPDFVRDVAVHEKYGLVATACRDEEVRVWNASSGHLLHVFAGHYEEVTGLAISGDALLSISIDGTLRRWHLAPSELQKAIQQASNPNLGEDIPEPDTDLGMLTAEEEAELRALMEDEEADTLESMAKDQR